MCNVVTKRFIETVSLLKEKNVVKSGRQLAMSLDFIPQSMHAILTGERDVTIDLLRKAMEIYPMNAQYIFTGSGTPLLEEETSHHHVDKPCSPNIHYVPVAAQAGYSEQYFDSVFLEDLYAFSLPQFKDQKGDYRCFEVNGDSMEPTLFSGEKVVCSLVRRENNYAALRNHYVYVVVTHHGIVVKRVVKEAEGTLTLVSDNGFYEAYTLPMDEIAEIWTIHLKISPFNSSPSHFQNGFQEKMKGMSETIETQSEAIKNLNRTLEQLLKQHRSTTVVR